MGVMWPIFQSFCSTLLSIDLFKRIESAKHKRLAHCLKTSAGHPSGPGALPVLREISLSYTIDGSMVILDNETLSLFSMLQIGAVLVSSVVKTLEKKLLNAFDLSTSEV